MAATVLPSSVWRAAARPEGTPGERYLWHRLGVSFEFPRSVRWLSARSVPAGVRMPPGSAGAVAYAFTAAVGIAVQLEAVDDEGRRILWRRRAKRWSVPGSDFGGGRRVFRARRGKPGRGAWLCEGPLDALAVMVRETVCGVPLGGAGVFGAAGVGGLTAAALEGVEGPVTVAAQADAAGLSAGRRLERALGAAGRSVRVVPAADGEDWLDGVALEIAERGGVCGWGR